MIEIKNISKLFGSKKALDNINITLYPGEIAALIGENGAGKSTLMRIMCGYLHPDTGSVNIFGHNTEKDRIKALSYIGYVPEISSLYGEMTVYDFLAWIAGIWNISNKNRAIFIAAKQMQIRGIKKELRLPLPCCMNRNSLFWTNLLTGLTLIKSMTSENL